MGKEFKRNITLRCLSGGLSVMLLMNTLTVPAAAEISGQKAGQGISPVTASAKMAVSETYKDPQKGTLNWREAMVSGNGENGVMESCHPVNDTFIFQNTTFNMPTNDYRETRDLSGELDHARQAVMGDQQWQSSVQSWLEYDYTLHPGHQLRLCLDDLSENEVTDYQRWTDYETAEIGVQFAAGGEVFKRSTFTSREDNVTITYLASPEGHTVNATLSVDDLSDMAIDQGREIDSGLEYKKLASEEGDYLGLVAHYPAYENSELKEGGFAGITRVVNIGGSRERVQLGTVDDGLHVGGNDNYGVRVKDADAVVLITKSDRDKTMGTLEAFAGQDSYALADTLIADTLAVAEKKEYQTDGVFDYGKALAPHVKLHGEEFNRVTFDLAGDEADDTRTNESLIGLQRSSDRLNHAMLERAFYAGRYAQICASGYSTSRLSGMWIGAWNGYWQADYTTDANVNLQISGVNIGNMPQSAEGYINFLLRILPDFEKNARQVYGMEDAIMAPPRTDGDRGNLVHFDKNYPFNYWNAGASWLLLPIYEYWQCFGSQQIPIGKNIDLEALRSVLSVENQDLTEEQLNTILSRGYFDLEQDLLLPLLTKQANFWEQIVDPEYYEDAGGHKHYEEGKTMLEDGERYLILPGYSPENAPGNTWIAISANSTMDIAAARSGLDMTIALEEAVKRPGYEKAVEKWKNLKAQLPEYKYDPDGSLKEWSLSDYTEQHNHRHVSQMYGIWPAHDEGDPRLAEGARKALDLRAKYNTGDDNASHGWLHRALTEARLGNAEGLTDCLLPLFQGSRLYYSSMMTNHDKGRDSAYCTDALITIPAIFLESLADSDTGTIELLPAVPEGWEKGSVTGIMARSRAEIESLGWDTASGEVTASIRSDVDQTLEVSCNMLCSQAEILSGSGEVFTDEALVRLDLKAGETAQLRFTREAAGTIRIADPGTVSSGTSVQMRAEVETGSGVRDDLEMNWSVENGTGKAQINPDGVLTALQSGTVRVQTALTAAPDSVQERELMIQPGILEKDRLAGVVSGRTEGEWESANPPALAFDGDTSTAYDGQNGGYAALELCGPFYLEGFRYVVRPGYGDRCAGIWIQGSDDGENWDTLYECAQGYDNPVYNGVWFGDLPEEERPAKPYSFYRVYSGRSDYCNVAEVEFYGSAMRAFDGLQNILLTVEGIDEEKYDPTGIAALREAAAAASKLTEQSPEEELLQAKEAVAAAVRNLEEPEILYNYDETVQTEGTWETWQDDRLYSGRELYTTQPGATFSFTFEGTGFEMMSNKNPGLGYVRILADGVTVPGGEEISLYDPSSSGYQKQSIFCCTGLEYGNHTVTVELLDKRNPEGNTPKVSVDAFRIFGQKPEPVEPDTPEADTTALRLAVRMAEKMEQEQTENQCYTQESWAEAAAALDQARKLLEDPEAAQEQVDEAFLNLITACSLVENGVQRVGLKAAIDGAKAVLEDQEALKAYTEESIAAVRTALAAAEHVFSTEISDQGTINAATTNLLSAVTSLLTGDEETRLDILIQKAKELLEAEEQYTPSSAQNLKDALAAAENVAGGQASEEEIRMAYNALAEAVVSLVRKADKAELKNAIDKAAEILGAPEKYLQESIAGLQAVKEEAQAVYDDQEADADAVGESLKKLIDEILKARLMGDVDLNGIVDTADSAEVLKYSAEMKELTLEQLRVGDTDHSGVTDSADASQILQYAAEITDTFE